MKEIIKITDENNNILNDRAEEIDIRKDNALMREIILELKDTLRNHKEGVGLAAPQIGYNKRIFVINFSGDLRSFINPIISEVKGFELSKEGCLSIPGKEFIRPRNNQITILYQTPLGKIESRKLVGKAAIVFQHEIDHLDGLLISDIGFEIDENYEKATEDEKTEIIQKYMDSLDIKKKVIEDEIQNDPQLKKQDDAIKFMEALQQGQVKFEKATDDIKEDVKKGE